MAAPDTSFEAWRGRLGELADAVRARVDEALSGGRRAELDRPVGRGAGDLTFGLDVPAEEALDAWLAERAREGPLSLLTEDRGWRHAGPEGPLESFDHGGPRIAVDPIDGTRNLMAGLRSAWTVVSFAPAGTGEPRLSELTGGLVSELPAPGSAGLRTLVADLERCLLVERDRAGAPRSERPLRVDGDDRPDHGYFPFFRYEPALRPALAELEARFFARLAEHEGADLRTVYDDQYISNAGQLFLLATGVYRSIVDARALLGARVGRATTTSKPYDVAGAIVCARAAGAVVTAAGGGPLDFPIDATTPVAFAGWANEGTRARLEPHWLAVLSE